MTVARLALLAFLALGAAGCGRARLFQPGSTRIDVRGVEQVYVPAGAFTMGTADTAGLAPPRWAVRELESELPAHRVRITRPFWIDRTEVTNAQFQAFVDAGGYTTRTFWSDDGWRWRREQQLTRPPACVTEVPDHPRVCVTWYEAEAYARWRGGRLPTEAEWEYAARGPESNIYPWGNVYDPARLNLEKGTEPVAVGSYPAGASWVGALDMAGNAMEWVQDWLDRSYYARSDSLNPPGPPTGTIKVEKGGWWGSVPFVARSAYRHFEDPPTYQDHHIGFRVVSPAPAPGAGAAGPETRTP